VNGGDCEARVTCAFASRYILLQYRPAYVNQPKAAVLCESCHVLVTAHILVNRLARLLEGKQGGIYYSHFSYS
jgi:hypothetical protein